MNTRKADNYEKYPNLMRVAQELAKCRNADKVAMALLTIIERNIQDSTDGNKDVGLFFSDVCSLADVTNGSQSCE